MKTFARLRDGETAIFGGLLKDEEQQSLQGLWGLADLPGIGRLFSNNRKTRAKTDVILTVRAVLVRRATLTERDRAAFNPEDIASLDSPFAPKAKKAAPKAPAKSPVAPPPAAPVNHDKQPKPGAVVPPTKPKPQPSPATPEATPAAAPDAPGGVPTPGDPAPTVPGAESTPPAPGNSELVVFMSPVSEQIGKNERVQLSILVSGGQGVDAGFIDIRVDPKLKLHGVQPGDFVLNENGTLQQVPGANGLVRISFKRTAPASSDSGTLAILDIEGLGEGNAPVLIQGGNFMIGGRPVGARWVSALVQVK